MADESELRTADFSQSAPQPTARDGLTLDALCARFAEAWSIALDGRHAPPRLEDYAGELGDEARGDLLGRLLPLDIEHRLRRGETVDAGDYLARFPEQASTVRSVLDPHTRFPSVTLGIDAHSQDRAGTVDVPSGLRVRCPHCRSAVDVSADTPLAQIACPSCGSNFGLAGDEALSYQAADGSQRRRQRLGHFELLEQLGAGAFGAVWKARDTELDRVVAVKIPRRGQLSDDEVERFIREARAAAQLRHPNIISVHEVGREGETIYIVSDFIEGSALDEWRTTQTLSRREAVGLAAKIARALHYAHEHGVIHRDLKPGNILVDRDGQPYVTDFGLAKREAGEITRTVEGQIMGTPAYMSPEQARGEGNRADRRTDVYSLGVMLFEFLTGERPFRGNMRMLLKQVIEDEPPRPRKLDAQVPRDLETICLKCLEKSPARRYGTAAELADELDRWLRGEPIKARRISRAARAWRWGRRNPAITSALVGIFLTLALATAVSTSFAINARLEQRRRVEALVQALGTAESESLPLIIQSLAPFRDDVLPQLAARAASSETPPRARVRIAAAQLALTRQTNPHELLDSLTARLLEASADEFIVLRRIIEPYRAQLSDGLWKQAGHNGANREQAFRAACVLADFDPHNQRWLEIADDVAAMLLAQPSLELPDWIEALRPVAARLQPALKSSFVSAPQRDERILAAIVLPELSSEPAFLVELAERSEPGQLPFVLRAMDRQRGAVVPRLRGAIGAPGAAQTAVQRANLAVALMYLGELEPVWSFLHRDADPAVRSEIIHRVAPAGIAPEMLVERLSTTADAGITTAVLLCLGEYRSTQLAISERRALSARLLKLYGESPDAGVHSAAEWLLGRWGFNDQLAQTRDRLAGKNLDEAARPQGRQWLVNREGQTLAVVHGPVEFTIGSPEGEQDRIWVEWQRVCRIPRTFAVGVREVTVREYLKFEPNREYEQKYSPEAECPMLGLSWYDAARYCRWLSEREGVPEDQMCFPPVEQIKADVPLELPENVLERTGYRLPTAAEWEFAARAGATTSRYFGGSEQLLPAYAWYRGNSAERSHPVGLLKPNDRGLFDVLGNALEWCQNWYFDEYPDAPPDQPYLDGADRRPGFVREMRGGGYLGEPAVVRLADRDSDVPARTSYELGFRLARTLATAGQND